MLVSHPHQKQAPLRTVDGCLSDYLVECLAEEFFPDWADALGPGLPVLESLVEEFLELHDIVPGCIGMRDVLHKPFLGFVLPLSGWYHAVEHIWSDGSAYLRGWAWGPAPSDYFWPCGNLRCSRILLFLPST